MLASFAEGSAILDRSDYGELARANARFLLNELHKDDLLLRTWKDDRAKLNGYLEDYGSLVHGLISLYEATGELNWIVSAQSLANKMIDQFWDENEGGFFFTGKDHEQLIVRSKEWLDNATPSGNSIAAFALLRLALLLGNDDYRRRAITILRLMSNQISRYPSAFGFALNALDFYLGSPLEIAIVGNQDNAGLLQLWRILWGTYLPNRIIALSGGASEHAAFQIPLLSGRQPVGTHATAFVCQNYACQLPVTSATEFSRQLTTRSAKSPSQ